MEYSDAEKIVLASPGVSGPWNGRDYDYARRAAMYAADRAEPTEKEKQDVIDFAQRIIALGFPA